MDETPANAPMKWSLVGKEKPTIEDKNPRLRGFVPAGSVSTRARDMELAATRLRRPYLFPCVGKDMEEKDADTQKPPSRICSKTKKLLRRTDTPQQDITTRRPPLLVMAESVQRELATV